MSKAEVNPGDVFGRWTVIQEVESPTKHRRMLCRCSCGTERIVVLQSLRAGETKSCGCLKLKIPEPLPADETENTQPLKLFVDWWQLIENLREAGKSYELIARDASVSKSVVTKLYHGDLLEPNWWDAIKLLDYHYDIMPLEKHLELGQ